MEAERRDALGSMLETAAKSVTGALRVGGAPLVALSATRTLGVALDHAMRALVDEAREQGSTWQEVGDVLGTTRQAAQQRFGSRSTKEEAMDETLADAGPKAVDALRRFLAADPSLVDDYTDEMRTAMTPERTAEAVEQITAGLGELTGTGDPLVRLVGAHTVVDVPMHFRNGPMKGRVAYEPGGAVAGLFILVPDAP